MPNAFVILAHLNLPAWQAGLTNYHDSDIALFLAHTVQPESTYSFTEVLPRPIHRLTSRSRLGKDVVCQNFTEVLPRFDAAHNTAVNGKTR